VLAMHMLYHVPDVAAAIAELRRVVRPGGVALIATNSEKHMQELGALLATSATAVTGIEPELIGTMFVTYTLENGRPALEASFASVERHDLVSELVITEVEPFISDSDDELARVLEEMRSRAAACIARDGAFRVRTASGIFVCRP
jgi:SAM-dependent methyltransferase